MTAFQFRLASVLKLRESVRDERRLALAEVLAADAVLEERLNKIRGELSAVRVDRPNQERTGSLDLDRLLDGDRFDTVLRKEQQALDCQRQQLAGEIEQRRAAVVEADADVRALEKLREAGLARHRDEERRGENSQLDEVASKQSRRSGVA